MSNPFDIVKVSGELTVEYRGVQKTQVSSDSDSGRQILLDAMSLWQNVPNDVKAKYLPWYLFDSKNGLVFKDGNEMGRVVA